MKKVSVVKVTAALKEEGYLYDSSLCLQETGWDYILDNMDVLGDVLQTDTKKL